MSNMTELKKSIAICEAAGCKFSDEEKADFEKVMRGEMTMDDVIKKFEDKLAMLRKERPELFEDSQNG